MVSWNKMSQQEVKDHEKTRIAAVFGAALGAVPRVYLAWTENRHHRRPVSDHRPKCAGKHPGRSRLFPAGGRQGDIHRWKVPDWYRCICPPGGDQLEESCQAGGLCHDPGGLPRVYRGKAGRGRAVPREYPAGAEIQTEGGRLFLLPGHHAQRGQGRGQISAQAHQGL